MGVLNNLSEKNNTNNSNNAIFPEKYNIKQTEISLESFPNKFGSFQKILKEKEITF